MPNRRVISPPPKLFKRKAKNLASENRVRSASPASSWVTDPDPDHDPEARTKATSASVGAATDVNFVNLADDTDADFDTEAPAKIASSKKRRVSFLDPNSAAAAAKVRPGGGPNGALRGSPSGTTAAAAATEVSVASTGPATASGAGQHGLFKITLSAVSGEEACPLFIQLSGRFKNRMEMAIDEEEMPQ